MSDSPLIKTWHHYREKVDGLKVRERVAVLLMALAVVYMLWDFVIFNPLATAKGKVDRQVAEAEQKIGAMASEEKAILAAVNADPDRDIKQHIATVEQQLDSLNKSLAELSVGLIPVEKLASILHDVLESTGKLQLQSLRTLPVEEVALARPETAAYEISEDDYTEEQHPGVYKHRVALTVKGNFRDLLVYLRTLENMHWRFYWDELHFNEANYPNAVITLHVYTLSTDEGLFGV